MLVSSSIFSSLRCFKTTLLIFLKSLTSIEKNLGFWSLLSVSAWTPRVEAQLNTLRAEQFSYRVCLSCVRPLLHLAWTLHNAKASGRWAQGHPGPRVTSPSLLPYPLLLLMFTHSSRADVGLQPLQLRDLLTSGLLYLVHALSSLDSLARTGISYILKSAPFWTILSGVLWRRPSPFDVWCDNYLPLPGPRNLLAQPVPIWEFLLQAFKSLQLFAGVLVPTSWAMHLKHGCCNSYIVHIYIIYLFSSQDWIRRIRPYAYHSSYNFCNLRA